MKKCVIKLLTLAAFVTLLFGVIEVKAEEEKPEASADVGVFSKYVWRGYELSDDSVVIQPSVTVGYKGFGINLWGNLDTDVNHNSDESQFNETDMTLSYDRSFGSVSLGVGYIYYGLDGIDDSEELYLSISYDTLLSPTLTVYREISHLPAWYLSFGVSHSFDLPKEITLDLAGSVGYYYYENADDGHEFDSNLVATTEEYRNFHNGLVSAGLTIPLNKYFTLTPMVAYSFPLSTKADDHIAATSTISDDSDYFYGGVTASLSF